MSTITPVDGDGSSPLYIGTRGDFYDLYTSQMEIAELMIFNTALPDTNLDNVQNYLASKYGFVLAARGPNHPPTVAITSPANGDTIAAPGNLTVTVAAADADGAVARVQLYVNGSVIATETAAPYQFTVQVTTPGNIILTAVATDNLGATSTNATVMITATGPPPPSSPVTNGLQLWLRADAGVTVNAGGDVTNWADQSGNGNNAAQADANAPLLVTNEVNGKPVLRFEGSPVYMIVNPSTNLTLAGNVTSFAVIRIDDYSVRHGLWNQTDNGSDPGPNDWSIMPAGDMRPRVNRGDGTGNFFAWYGQPLPFQPAYAPGQFFILGWEAVGLTEMTHLFNDETNSYQNYGSIIVPTDVGNPLLIGTRNDLTSEQLKGDMAELLIYDRALSSTELATVEEYLAGRYGIPFAASTQAGPSVSIVSPINGSSFGAPANFNVTAEVTATSGSSVSNVQLFVNGAPFAVLSAPPYHWPVLVSGAGTVALTVTATDSDSLSNSASTTINVTAPAYTVGTNLVLWLKADAGVTTNGSNGVTAWADQSSYGNNAVAGTTPDGSAVANPPVLMANAVNGEPSIQFNNSSSAVEYLEVPDSPSIAVTGDMTFVLVVNIPAAMSSYHICWFQGDAGVPSPTGLLFNSDVPLVQRYASGSAGDTCTGAAAVTAGQYAVVTFTQAGDAMKLFLNGSPSGTQTAANAPYTDFSPAPLFIGTRESDFYRLTTSGYEMAEFMIFNTALTGTNLDDVNNYVIAKYSHAGRGRAIPDFGHCPPRQFDRHFMAAILQRLRAAKRFQPDGQLGARGRRAEQPSNRHSRGDSVLSVGVTLALMALHFSGWMTDRGAWAPRGRCGLDGRLSLARQFWPLHSRILEPHSIGFSCKMAPSWERW